MLASVRGNRCVGLQTYSYESPLPIVKLICASGLLVLEGLRVLRCSFFGMISPAPGVVDFLGAQGVNAMCNGMML